MENKNLVDILEFEGLYKFDTELEQVYSIRRNIYLKNNLCKSKGYYQVSLYKNRKRKNIFIHKLIYIINNPTEDISEYQIDHIDGNRLNNKIENLRKCSPSDNQSNKKAHKNNKLGIKYIYKTKYGYRFELTKNKITYIKTFKNLQDAIEYRNIKVKEINGEFANLG